MKPRILVVDDNRSNRYLAAYLLAQAGCTVFEAEDGDQGVAVARRELPDAIVMDLSMPHLDGHGALQQLRADPATRAIPVVASSAFAGPAERSAALAAGFADFIEKPVSRAGFVERVLAQIPRPPATEGAGT